MKRTAIAGATVLLAITGLAGCGGGEATVAAQPGAPAAPVANQSPKEALRTAIQGYMDAVLSGDIVGAAAYVDPACDDSSLYLAVPMFSKTANGARMIIDSVYLDEKGGGTDKYHTSPGAPDAFRRLLANDDDGKREYSFRMVDGQWVHHPDPCDPPTPDA